MGFFEILNEWYNPNESDMLIPAIVIIGTGYFFTKYLETKKSRIIGAAVMLSAYAVSAILLPLSKNYMNMFLSLYIGGASISLFFGLLLNSLARKAIDFFIRHPANIGSDSNANRMYGTSDDNCGNETGDEESADSGKQ